MKLQFPKAGRFWIIICDEAQAAIIAFDVDPHPAVGTNAAFEVDNLAFERRSRTIDVERPSKTFDVDPATAVTLTSIGALASESMGELVLFFLVFF